MNDPAMMIAKLAPVILACIGVSGFVLGFGVVALLWWLWP